MRRKFAKKVEEDEEILGSGDDEQENPDHYTTGRNNKFSKLNENNFIFGIR
jgi:hypothetical protein